MVLVLVRSLSLTLFASAALASLLPSPAHACSGVYVCRKLESVQPADEAVDVPRNIELRITYTNAIAADARASASLESDDGQVVPTTWHQAQRSNPAGTQLWIGRPTTPLLAATHYRLRHSYRACSETDAGFVSPESGCGGLCLTTIGDVISEFTTGASSDERDLSPPVLGAPTLSYIDTQVSSAACGPYSRCVYSVAASALTTGQRLRVMSGTTFVGDFGKGLSIGVHRIASNGFDRNVDLNQTGAAQYAVSVVDATGNQSAARVLSVPACTEAPDSGTAQPNAAILDGSLAQPDSGVPPPGGGLVRFDSAVPQSGAETGLEDGGTTAPTEDNGGCSLHGGRSAWTCPLWVALAMLVARRSRRGNTL